MSLSASAYVTLTICISLVQFMQIASTHETKETKDARRLISKKYHDLYMKECSPIFDKLKKLADECTRELKMVIKNSNKQFYSLFPFFNSPQTNEHVEKCVKRVPKPKPKRKPKPTNTTEDLATTVAAIVENTSPQSIVISDNGSSPTTSPSTIVQLHSWHHIWSYENKVRTAVT